ncbi:LysR family transcriptional regulator [Kiloniella litopenaei]|uniref:LysR family transcriptional regulator n=1 Tax=Kiloniella litopenaei TaxID=1549748 RepID=UPI000698A9AD|nr:LysR family transcriptional regulator [Kiloniella litopenaei]
MSDWDDYRYFQAVMKYGGLSAAARELGVSQPTVGRRITAMEERLGQQLLERDGKYVQPTAYGLLLAERIAPLVETAFCLERELESFGQRDYPPVRLTATGGLATYWLPKVIAQLQGREPDLKVLLTPGNQVEDIDRGDADIAFRIGGRKVTDLIEKQIFALKNALWASEKYLEAYGMPRSKADLGLHKLVAFNEVYMSMPAMESFASRELSRNIVFRSDNVPVQAQAVLAGIGIGILPSYIAIPLGLCRIQWQDVIPETQVSMLCHPEALKNSHVNFLWHRFLQDGAGLMASLQTQDVL